MSDTVNHETDTRARPSQVQIIYGQCWLEHAQTDAEKHVYGRGVRRGIRQGRQSISRTHWFMCGAMLCLIAVGLAEVIWGL